MSSASQARAPRTPADLPAITMPMGPRRNSEIQPSRPIRSKSACVWSYGAIPFSTSEARTQYEIGTTRAMDAPTITLRQDLAVIATTS